MAGRSTYSKEYERKGAFVSGFGSRQIPFKIANFFGIGTLIAQRLAADSKVTEGIEPASNTVER